MPSGWTTQDKCQSSLHCDHVSIDKQHQTTNNKQRLFDCWLLTKQFQATSSLVLEVEHCRTGYSLGLWWLTRYPLGDQRCRGTGRFGAAAEPGEEAPCQRRWQCHSWLHYCSSWLYYWATEDIGSTLLPSAAIICLFLLDLQRVAAAGQVRLVLLFGSGRALANDADTNLPGKFG